MRNYCLSRDTVVFLMMVIILTAAKQAEDGDNRSSSSSLNGARTSSLLRRLLAEEEGEADQQRDLIVGGKEANPGDFPYYVHLMKCGGSLIAPRVVLTAAHCGEFMGDTAYVGCHDYGRATGDAVNRKVDDQVIHPDYDSDTFAYDFNLLLLDEAVNLEDHTDIVLTLNEDDLVPTDGQEVTVLGLGLLEEDGETPDKVRYVEVEKTADEYCNDAYGGDIEDSVQFCAGVEGGGKDACQGDSGGPLVVEYGSKRHVQVGVVSSGTGCASADYPGVYARVSGQMEWIRSIVCTQWNQTDASFCPSSTTMAGRSGGSSSSGIKFRSSPLEWFRIQSTKDTDTTTDGTDSSTAYCLSLEHGRVATNGEAIVMLPCDGTYQQQWTQFDNDYLIRSKMNPNKCIRLGTSSDSDEGDEVLELYDCFDSDSTPFEAYSDDTIRLKDDSSQCWEFKTGAGGIGVTDCLDSSTGGDESSIVSQQWKTTLRKDDLMRTKSAVHNVLETKQQQHTTVAAKHHHDDKVEIRDVSSSFRTAPPIPAATHVPHEPREEDDSASWFGIRNVKTDTCLTLNEDEEYSTDNDDLTLLVLEACDLSKTEQRWKFVNNELQSVAASNKCVVPSGDASFGSPVLVYECLDSNMYGEWTIPAFDNGDDVGPILSSEDSNKCLASNASDSVVILGHCPDDEEHTRDDRLWEAV